MQLPKTHQPYQGQKQGDTVLLAPGFFSSPLDIQSRSFMCPVDGLGLPNSLNNTHATSIRPRNTL